MCPSKVRRNSSSASCTNGRRASVGRRDSRRGPVAKGERHGARPPKFIGQEDDVQRVRPVGDETIENGESVMQRCFVCCTFERKSFELIN